MSLSESVPESRPPRLAVADAVAWSVLASLLFHAALLAAAVWWPRRPVPATPDEPSVAVDFIASDAYDAATAPQAPAPAAAPVLPVPQAPTGLSPAPGMIRPTTMLSALALAEAGTAEAAKELAHFNGDERAVQLCNLEAMEQVHAWRANLKPERIIAYATADAETTADKVKAPGAAFLAGGEWYGLAYECLLSPDRATVDGFQFKVGDPIPRAEWDADHLPTAK